MYKLFLEENRKLLLERISPIIVVYVLSLGYLVVGIHDPFPGHSVDFLIAAQAAGVFMVIFGSNKISEFICAFIPAIIGSIDEFYNFLPGPGVKDILDIYCYFGGTLLSYILSQLVRKNINYALSWYSRKPDVERVRNKK